VRAGGGFVTERADAATAEKASRPVPRPLGTGYRAPWSDRIAEAVIRGLALVSVLSIALIFVFIAKEAIPLFFEPEAQQEFGGLGALFSPRAWPGYDASVFIWQPVGGTPKMNLVPLFVGTLKITALGMLISIPLAVLAAIFVSQYATRRAREVLKPALELMASIPSVVLGFFALMVLASLMQDTLGLPSRLNAFVAAVGLAIAITPVVFTVSEDALSSVPRELAAAALALGARKHQVVLRIVLPAALPGIAAGAILGFGRAIGETMIVLMASGNAAVVELFDPTSSARTVTATVASELGEVTPGDAHWRVLFLLGSLLFVVTFALNRLAVWVVEALQRRWTAGASR
jgi:phosphate transport system permease protein